MLPQYKRLAVGLLALVILLTVALCGFAVAFFVTKYAPPKAPTADELGSGTGADIPADGAPDAPSDGITLTETPDAGAVYQDSLTFVGDSLTAHMVNRGVLNGGQATTQVWRTESGMFNLKPGMTAQTVIYPGPGEHTGRLVTVAEAAAIAKPAILIVTLGTDWGVAYLKEEDFKICYTEFILGIREASPETVVVLQSIFPVTAGCSVLTNAQIDTANKWVHAVAAATDCRYLDTQSVLKDESGCLKAAYCNSADGIHLGAEGYAAVLTYIRTHALTD